MWISLGEGKTSPPSRFRRKTEVTFEGTQDSYSSQKIVVLGHVNEGDRYVDLIPIWQGHGVAEKLLWPAARAQHCLGWRSHHHAHGRIPPERKMEPHHISPPGPPHGPCHLTLHSVNFLHLSSGWHFQPLSLSLSLWSCTLCPHGGSELLKFPHVQEHWRNKKPGSHLLLPGLFC